MARQKYVNKIESTKTKDKIDWSLFMFAIMIGFMLCSFLILFLNPFNRGYQKGFEAGQENTTIPYGYYNSSFILDNLENMNKFPNNRICFVDRVEIEKIEDNELGGLYKEVSARRFCIESNGTWTASWRSNLNG